MSLEIQQPLILVKEQHISKAEAKANSAVRKVNAECSFCRRYNGRVMEQKMAELPKERIVPDLTPFTNVRLFLTCGNKERKNNL